MSHNPLFERFSRGEEVTYRAHVDYENVLVPRDPRGRPQRMVRRRPREIRHGEPVTYGKRKIDRGPSVWLGTADERSKLIGCGPTNKDNQIADVSMLPEPWRGIYIPYHPDVQPINDFLLLIREHLGLPSGKASGSSGVV